MSLFEHVRSTIATTLKVPEHRITASTVQEDLPAWDSLGQVNLVMALEQTFDLMIEVEDFEQIKSVPAILAYLDQQGVR
jgi:acyl carrier protein